MSRTIIEHLNSCDDYPFVRADCHKGSDTQEKMQERGADAFVVINRTNKMLLTYPRPITFE